MHTLMRIQTHLLGRSQDTMRNRCTHARAASRPGMTSSHSHLRKHSWAGTHTRKQRGSLTLPSARAHTGARAHTHSSAASPATTAVWARPTLRRRGAGRGEGTGSGARPGGGAHLGSAPGRGRRSVVSAIGRTWLACGRGGDGGGDGGPGQGASAAQPSPAQPERARSRCPQPRRRHGGGGAPRARAAAEDLPCARDQIAGPVRFLAGQGGGQPGVGAAGRVRGRRYQAGGEGAAGAGGGAPRRGGRGRGNNSAGRRGSPGPGPCAPGLWASCSAQAVDFARPAAGARWGWGRRPSSAPGPGRPGPQVTRAGSAGRVLSPTAGLAWLPSPPLHTHRAPARTPAPVQPGRTPRVGPACSRGGEGSGKPLFRLHCPGRRLAAVTYCPILLRRRASPAEGKWLFQDRRGWGPRCRAFSHFLPPVHVCEELRPPHRGGCEWVPRICGPGKAQ